MAKKIKYAAVGELSWRDRINASLALLILVFSLSYIFEFLGIGNIFGSASSAESNSWITELGLFVFSLFTLVPLLVALEELFFRLLPYKVSLKSKNRHFWLIGIMSAFVFAWFHSLEGLKSFSGFAIPQLVAGIYLWRYIPTGYKNVFWIHYFYNLFAGIVVQILLISDISG